MAKVKIGLVGLGSVGNIHLRNGLRVANANLVAVADVSKRALSEAKNAGVDKIYSNYKHLMRDPEVDAVIIALPTYLHIDCARQAAEAGKHILLEKPIGKNVAEAKEITSIVQRNSVKLMMGYPLRFNEVMRNLRKQYLSEDLGDVETAYASNVGSGPFEHRMEGYGAYHVPVPVPEWWFNRDLSGGGVLIDLGCHMINLLRWYFGEIIDIRSYLGYRFDMDLEDHAICVAQFESGTTAMINLGWFSQKHQVKVELCGTVKHAEALNVPRKRILAGARMLTRKAFTFMNPYLAELEYFVNCIVHEIQPSPSEKDGLRDLEAIELAYRNSVKL
jgi:myo-inositol 2-dehydrogenase/D-chiro-inositol 1-dehydrogenase